MRIKFCAKKERSDLSYFIPNEAEFHAALTRMKLADDGKTPLFCVLTASCENHVVATDGKYLGELKEGQIYHVFAYRTQKNGENVGENYIWNPNEYNAFLVNDDGKTYERL